MKFNDDEIKGKVDQAVGHAKESIGRNTGDPVTEQEGAERAWITDFVPAELRGKGFGIYYLASGFGVLAGTALFGVLYERVSPQSAFYAGAALAIAAAIAAGTARGTAPSR